MTAGFVDVSSIDPSPDGTYMALRLEECGRVGFWVRLKRHVRLIGVDDAGHATCSTVSISFVRIIDARIYLKGSGYEALFEEALRRAAWMSESGVSTSSLP